MKVLIVEDEIYSRQSLIKQVQGFDSDFEILEAANGKKALELFWSEKPELILSDIEMPFVSGLELLQQVASSKGNSKVVLISGYADFQYAQEALNAGAAGYLLKPVSDETLHDCLRKVLKQSDEEHKIAAGMKLLHYSDGLSKYICDGLSSGRLPDDYVHEKMFQRMMTPYRVIVCSFSTKKYPESVEFQSFLQQFLSKNIDLEYRFVMLSRHKWIILSKDYDTVIETFQKMNSYMDQHHWKYTLGVSKPQDSAECLFKAYAQAVTAAEYRLINSRVKLFDYAQVRERYPVKVVPFCKTEQLRHYLEQKNAAGAYSLIQEAFQKIGENEQASVSCYETILHMLAELIQKQGHQQGREMPYAEIALNLEGYDTLEEVLEAVRGVIDFACSELPGQPEPEDGGIVDKVLDYIHQNYNKDISLKELAENVFYMNHSYLSHLIREKTSKNYSSYLKEIRISHAKDLLGDPGLSITEVANLSGYNDASQFIQVFKKEMGMTPKKYRELLQKDQLDRSGEKY